MKKIALFSLRVNVIVQNHIISIVNNNFNMSDEFLYLLARYILDRF